MNTQRLFSLRLEDALPHDSVELEIQTVLLSPEAASQCGASYSMSSHAEDEGKPKVLFELNVDQFDDLLCHLKLMFNTMRRVARAICASDFEKIRNDDRSESASSRRASLTSTLKKHESEHTKLRESFLPAEVVSLANQGESYGIDDVLTSDEELSDGSFDSDEGGDSRSDMSRTLSRRGRDSGETAFTLSTTKSMKAKVLTEFGSQTKEASLIRNVFASLAIEPPKLNKKDRRKGGITESYLDYRNGTSKAFAALRLDVNTHICESYVMYVLCDFFLLIVHLMQVSAQEVEFVLEKVFVEGDQTSVTFDHFDTAVRMLLRKRLLDSLKGKTCHLLLIVN